MPGPDSIRTRFQTVVVALTLAAIGVTGWIASTGAGAALRSATYDRLRAVRETKGHALERYFENLRGHVTALSTSEATVAAVQRFDLAWSTVAEATPGSVDTERLRRFYEQTLAPRLNGVADAASFVARWFPADPRTQRLQSRVIAGNPYPVGSKDLLFEIPDEPVYSRAHAAHHPTFHRYQSAFGFYDIFLISVPEGRVLYTVMKEVDLGANLTVEPYRSTRLGRAYRRVIDLPAGEAETTAVLEDYAPYVASEFAPAAFIAAPVRVAGATIGVLAMQLSIREVDRVMTGGQRWRDEGLGETGHAYVIGSDGTLRSDLRAQIENPDVFLTTLQARGVSDATIGRIRHDQTSVLNLPMDLSVVESIGEAGGETEFGVSLQGTPVLRSHAPLQVADLSWTVVAEIDAAEALGPVRALQTRILTAGVVLAGLFFAVAGWLGASVTRPILELARMVTRIGSGDRGATVPVRSADEVGQLANAFNQMSEALARTTVSKSELEVLAGRLITAQEDERRRVARELHDDLVQRVAATAIEVGRLAQVPSEEERRAGLSRLRRTLADLSQDVHGLSRRIHPAMLDELGLHAAIETECRAFMERGGPPVDLRAEGAVNDVPKDVALALYRIVQESLRNAWQHADATEVSVVVARATSIARLDIIDNGRGFARDAPGWKPGLGLASMEERVRLLGGSLTVASAPNAGTRVTATVPVESADVETTYSPR